MLVALVFSSRVLKKIPIQGRAIHGVQPGNVENYTESSLGSLQLLSMCLFMNDSGTLA